jgi:ribosomal protein S18 acetylase RimI-like enzyme
MLLVHAGQSCGFLSCGIAGDDLEIRKIGVLPAYRRLGLGKQLLRHAMNHTPAGVRRCLIEVSAGNIAGLAFYRTMGFAEIGRRSNYYSDGTAAIIMEKILSAP